MLARMARDFLSSPETWTPKRIAGISRIFRIMMCCEYVISFDNKLTTRCLSTAANFMMESIKYLASNLIFGYWDDSHCFRRNPTHIVCALGMNVSRAEWRVKHRQMGCEKFQEHRWVEADRQNVPSAHVNNGIPTFQHPYLMKYIFSNWEFIAIWIRKWTLCS